MLCVAVALSCVAEVPSDDLELSAGDPAPYTGAPTDDPEPKLDVPPLDAPPCTGLDVLFVVDNSGSMGDNQDAFAAAVPGFVQSLSALGIGYEGLHVGVVSTDSYDSNPAPCQTLGALVTVVNPDGYGPEYAECGPYADGHNYMTDADDLPVSFACAANLGTTGDGSERPVDAMLEALDGWLAQPGGCNEGFHRRGLVGSEGGVSERAGLVVVFITDEEDISSAGDVDDWIDHLEYLRRPFGAQAGGPLTDTVLVGIIPDETKAPKLNSLVDYVGDVEADEYGNILSGAVPVVAAGCGLEFEPVP